MIHPAPAACILALTAVATPALAGDVLVVEPGAPGAFSEIQDAVDAAASGDIVLVKTGSYGAFEVVGKGLSVVADDGASVLVQGAVQVRSTGVAQDVVLSGLHAVGELEAGPDLRHGIALATNPGSIRLVGCTFEAAIGGVDTDCTQAHGARVENCADVVFVGCLLRGRSNDNLGGLGLDARASRIALYDSLVIGGDGGSTLACSGFDDGGNGGPAVVYRDSLHLLLHRSELVGGDGAPEGKAMSGECLFPGAGGSAIRRFGLGSAPPWVLDSTLTSGVTAPCTDDTCTIFECPPPPVPPTFGRTVSLQGNAPSLEVPRILREGEAPVVTFHGQPDQRVALFVGNDTGYRIGARNLGLVVAPRPSLVLIAGTLDGSGTLTRAVPAPLLAPGEEGRTVFLQAMFRLPGGVATTSGVGCLTVVR